MYEGVFLKQNFDCLVIGIKKKETEVYCTHYIERPLVTFQVLEFSDLSSQIHNFNFMNTQKL
jgi:hypothetical protein